jgi:Fe-S oxidoreductase
MPVIGIEPSELYTLCEEFLDFFPRDEWVHSLAKRAWLVDEFLIRPQPGGEIPVERLARRMLSQPNGKLVLLHGHCHQKARPPADDGYPVGVEATASLLRSVGYRVNIIEAGCCGMAGAFGYEAEHYDLSMRIGEMSLLPQVRAAPDGVIIAAAGTSCRAQIEDGTGRQAIHPISLIQQVL